MRNNMSKWWSWKNNEDMDNLTSFDKNKWSVNG